MMNEHDDGTMIAEADDADKDEIRTDDDSSTTSTEASSTDATDVGSIDEYSRDTSSYPSIAKPLTISLTVLVAVLSVLVAAHPSLYTTSCGEVVASLFAWYLATLEVFPLITKCITGALLAVVGDYCAQWFECKTSDEEQQLQQEHMYESESMLQNTISILSIRGKYDCRRGYATALETFLLSCPLQHYAYNYFESILPVESGSELYLFFAALVHVCLDCLVLDAVFVATGIVVGGMLEGHNFSNYVLPNLIHNYFSAFRAVTVTNVSFSPVLLLSFRFLPLPLRVLSNNAVDLVWNCVVSYATHGAAVIEKATA